MTEFKDTMKISEMVEGTKYACTQQGHGFSDGVWMTKRGNEIELRHFWSKEQLDHNKDGFYTYDENDEVCYPTKATDDQKDFIHADIMQVIPEAITHQFEDMTLAEFYDVVFMGIYYMTSDGYDFPKHLEDKRKVYSRDGEFMYGLDISA